MTERCQERVNFFQENRPRQAAEEEATSIWIRQLEAAQEHERIECEAMLQRLEAEQGAERQADNEFLERLEREVEEMEVEEREGSLDSDASSQLRALGQ